MNKIVDGAISVIMGIEAFQQHGCSHGSSRKSVGITAPTFAENNQISGSQTLLFAAHCKTHKNFLAHFVYKIKYILICFKL
jgi:hypothetical protein